MFALRFIAWLFSRRLRQQTNEYLAKLTNLPEEKSRQHTASMLAKLIAEGTERVPLGFTKWGQAVELALTTLCSAHSFISGGSGGGKSRFVALICDALLKCTVKIAFGLLDPKSETFLNVLYLFAQLAEQLPPPLAAALLDRLIIIDLSLANPLCEYNFAKLWDGADLDYFVASRMETLQELLPRDQGFSLRGEIIVRHLLKLLAECQVPFAWINKVIDDEALRNRLLERVKDSETIDYFKYRFANESKLTIAAVQSRFSSFMSRESIRLALSGNDAPDFRRYQDEGKIVLINCPSRILQQLILSDIRNSVYVRRNQQSYLWVLEEAQNFFRTAQMRENFDELLRQARSFGTFFCVVSQNISSAVRDASLLQNLITNTRWSFSLRGAPSDAMFLRDSLPVTGRMPKPSLNPFKEQEFYSLSEERANRLAEIAHLPDRTGWFWVRSLSPEPILMSTADLDLPEMEIRMKAINKLRLDPKIGQRLSRAEYLKQIEWQQRELTGLDPIEIPDQTIHTLRKRYRSRKSQGAE